jgi:hypothetical protein
LADTPDLGSGDESRGGSSPSARTNEDPFVGHKDLKKVKEAQLWNLQPSQRKA